MSDETRWWLLNGDCKAILSECPDSYIDAMVTDPPAGISFMHKSWDGDKGGRVPWVQQYPLDAGRAVVPVRVETPKNVRAEVSQKGKAEDILELP